MTKSSILALLLLFMESCSASLPVIRVQDETAAVGATDWMRENSGKTAASTTATTLGGPSSLSADGCNCSCPHEGDCVCDCPQTRLERRRQLERSLAEATSLEDCPGAVVSMHLWDAKKDVEIQEITAGDTICKPRVKINLEARVKSCPTDAVESVEFHGSLGNAIENEFRYFNYGDYLGNIFGKRIRPGHYSVTAVPFSQDNATGIEGKNLTRSFQVINCPKARVESTPPSKKAGSQTDGELGSNASTVSAATPCAKASASHRKLTLEDDDTHLPGITAYEYDFVLTGDTSVLEDSIAQVPGVALAHDCSAITDTSISDTAVWRRLDETFDHLFQNVHHDQYAFSCPSALYRTPSLTRLAHHSPQTKLVIGLVHPVYLLQQELEKRPQTARMDLFLMQLGHTTLMPNELHDMATSGEIAVVPHSFPALIYAHEQVTDSNIQRNAKFRSSLKSFLNLPGAIPQSSALPLPVLGDICLPRYASLRAEWMQQGVQAAEWLREHFVNQKNDHVQVIHPEHLLKILGTWGTDPCRSKRIGSSTVLQ